MAFCLDEAVFHFGTQVQSELDAVDDSSVTSRKMGIDKILEMYFSDDRIKLVTAAPKGTFADPAMLMGTSRVTTRG